MTEMTVRQHAGRKAPWGVHWREAIAPGSKTTRKRARFFDTQADAERFKRESEAKAKLPDTPGTTKPTPGTLGSYLPDWLKHVETHREAATHRAYEQVERLYIRPHLGHVKVTDLDSARVLKFYNALQEQGVKLGNRMNVHRSLSAAFQYLVVFTKDVLKYNPCRGLGRLMRHRDEEAVGPEPNPFTRQERNAFLKDVETNEADWLEYLQFLFDQGVRVGEASALTWAKVDLDRREAIIDRSYSPSAGKDKSTKTGRRRVVSLTDVVVTQLKEWRARQRREAFRRGSKPSEYVFTDVRGVVRHPNGNVARVFERVLERCELNHHTPHDCRDTFATIHLTDDWNRLGWVSAQLGHRKVSTTENHYFKWRPTEESKRYANLVR